MEDATEGGQGRGGGMVEGGKDGVQNNPILKKVMG